MEEKMCGEMAEYPELDKTIEKELKKNKEMPTKEPKVEGLK
jgi:hypothetical protein